MAVKCKDGREVEIALGQLWRTRGGYEVLITGHTPGSPGGPWARSDGRSVTDNGEHVPCLSPDESDLAELLYPIVDVLPPNKEHGDGTETRWRVLGVRATPEQHDRIESVVIHGRAMEGSVGASWLVAIGNATAHLGPKPLPPLTPYGQECLDAGWVPPCGEKANWLAKECDGDFWLFVVQPVEDGDGWFANGGGLHHLLEGFFPLPPKPTYWRESLIDLNLYRQHLERKKETQCTD